MIKIERETVVVGEENGYVNREYGDKLTITDGIHRIVCEEMEHMKRDRRGRKWCYDTWEAFMHGQSKS